MALIYKKIYNMALYGNACWFLGRQHSVGTPLGGAVVDQRHQVHINGSQHLTPVTHTGQQFGQHMLYCQTAASCVMIVKS